MLSVMYEKTTGATYLIKNIRPTIQRHLFSPGEMLHLNAMDNLKVPKWTKVTNLRKLGQFMLLIKSP